ncbi:MAG: hypothetical protein FWC78_08770 [Defluviitaleaceae bacterium]|nr:hypothetical protein [Defluviitaleaceae bacterium]
MKNPFIGKQIRTFQDQGSKVWWFSAVDVCAALIGCGQDVARTYWLVNKLRWQLDGKQLITDCNKLKMKSRDGKMRFTDVLDITQVLYLIQIIPSPEAEPFKRWLAEAAAAGCLAATQLAEAGEANKKIILDEIIATGSKPYEMLEITRTPIYGEINEKRPSPSGT